MPDFFAWISFFRQLFCHGWKIHNQFCLHDKGIPEGWKVKEEESQPEEFSGSIGRQVQDRISFSWINIHLFCYGWKIHNQFCLHGKSIPEGWKVKEEESQSEECSGSIGSQVQDQISLFWINVHLFILTWENQGYRNCNRRWGFTSTNFKLW